MRGYVRGVLIAFAAFELVLGVWLTFTPRTFYDHVPTVDWDPPYNDHLFHDLGGTSLGLGIVLVAAAVRFDRFLVRVALLAYLAFTVSHLVFHLGHLHGDEPGWSVVLSGFVVLMVVLPLTALVGTRRMT
ncbi:hypothetical protein [Kribbella speibonae]|uniref:DUF4345 domain-containing protein n=1 Tax=Kribbella speibonae TaxID=1572660 RepID=A0ABY2AAB7_9ACTN|nr:hypothetical protein [Kribbella speibonae]TCC25549.1 hypothetical protein E0H58_15620 [Kribbella speibonae]